MSPSLSPRSRSPAFFPLSGFWSKDEIVASTLHHPVFLVLTLLIAFMTAFYMFRLCFLTFFGKPRDEHRYEHAHESPKSMTYPLIFLSILAVCAGWVALPWLHHGYSSFVYHGEIHHAGPNYVLMLGSLVVAMSGIGLAYVIYYKKLISADSLAAKFKPLHTFLYNKWYFDELYHYTIIAPLMFLARFLWGFDAKGVDGVVNGAGWLAMAWARLKFWIDRWIVDGAVNGSGWLVRQGGNLLRFVQNGAVQFYGLFILGTMIVFVLYKFELVHNKLSWPWLSAIFVLGLGFLSVVAKKTSAKTKTADMNPEK